MLEEQNSRFPFRDDGSGAPCLPMLCDWGPLEPSIEFPFTETGGGLRTLF